jgi:hypothetical protein
MASLIVAGDTSGSITISAPLVAGSGVLTLPTGTDTLVGKATVDTLTNKSIAATQLTGTIAAAALPAGTVLQVVNGTYGIDVGSSTTTFVDTGLTATITPRSTSSKILVIVNQAGCSKANNAYMHLQLLRGASSLIVFETTALFTNTATSNNCGSCSVNYLDSPATTSATTYKTQVASRANIASVSVQSNASYSTITLMEIQG